VLSHAHSAPGVSAHAFRRVQFSPCDAVVDTVVLIPFAQREPRTDRVPIHTDTAIVVVPASIVE